ARTATGRVALGELALLDADRHLRSRAARLDRVDDDVGQDLLELARVREDADLARRFDGELDAALLRERLQHFDARAREARELHLPLVSGLPAGEVEQLAHDERHALRLLADDARAVAHLAGLLDLALLDHRRARRPHVER